MVVERPVTFLGGQLECMFGYFDEVKADRDQRRNNYLVAGLIIPMDQIGIIESQITALAEELFQSKEFIFSLRRLLLRV
jgi:hypothetical protein